MIRITDKIFLNIKIDGHEVPESFNLIDTIALTEGNNAAFPACLLIFNDLSGYLKDQLNLVDGNSIVVTVGKDASDVSTITRQYRLFGSKCPASPVGSVIKIAGIYDAPDYTTANAREAYRGTSSQVLEKLASICKLTYDGPERQTKDFQVWMNICKTRSAFMQEIAKHGYLDDYSCMSLVLTSLGVLKYKNLIQLMEQEPKFTLAHNVLPESSSTGKTYIVKQARDSSTSGIVNSWQNYGSTKIIHNLSGQHIVEDKVDVKTAGKYLAINKQISDTVGMSRVEYAPLDCSNVNEKFERAFYQNMRLLALFCEKESVLVTEATDIQLYDLVFYRQADADLMKPAEQADTYLVSGKTIFVKGGQSYAERLELVRMSVSNKGQSPLATQDPSSLRDNSIPESLINPTINVAQTTLSIVTAIAQIFSIISNPTRLSFSSLSPLSSMGSLSALKLETLTNIISTTGISSSIVQSLTALQSSNGALTQLSSTLTSIAGNYITSDFSFNSIVSQLQALPPEVNSKIYSANLQKAALFNPAGVMYSLATLFPILNVTSHFVNVNTSIQAELTQNSIALLTRPAAASILSNYDSSISSMRIDNSILNSKACNIWNLCVSLANNKPIPTNLFKFDNTQILTDIAQSSLEVPPGNRNKVQTLNETIATMSNSLQLTDPNKELLWMNPEKPIYQPVTYTASELPGALSELQLGLKKLSLIPVENTLG